MRYRIGVDEAGRGPLAGPVTVGAVLLPDDFDFDLVQGAKDSKKMIEKERERIYKILLQLRQQEKIQFAVAFSPPEAIDSIGIVPAISFALEMALSSIEPPLDAQVLLDGSLKAPERFKNQRTIIRGDSLEPIISLASIAAKVERDHFMKGIAEQFPEYGFEVHKGYGTHMHRERIARLGLSPLHRASFCRRILALE